MRYELYLRSLVENKGWPRERLLQVLEAVGFAVGDGLPTRLPEFDFAVEAYLGQEGIEGEDWFGLNFSFPLGSNDADGRRAIDGVFDVCEQVAGQVFDPQLGRMVDRKQHDAICDSWRRSYEFHSGVAGAVGLGTGAPSLELPDEDDGWLARYKPILLTGLVILVFVFIFRSCFSSWFEQALVAPPPVSQPAKQP